MLGPLNQHIGRKLASFIVAFGLAFTFQPIPASAGNDNESCQPTVPYDLSPSEFEELRKELWDTGNTKEFWETGNTRDIELSLKVKTEFSDHPFFPLLLSVRHIDRGEFINALITLEGLEFRSLKADFCQNVFISEIALALRHFAISSLLSKDTRNFRSWDSLGYSGLRYFLINDYGAAKCIILNARVEPLKLDREPTFEEYPRHCVVR